MIARYMKEGSTVHVCLLEAFDSVKLPVLLDRLFSIGINGKTWRLIRDWYEGVSKSMVQFQNDSPLREVSAKGQYCPQPSLWTPF